MSKLYIVVFTMLLVLSACKEDGPAERFGEEVDQAAGNVQDAARDAANQVEDVATDVGNSVEDTCEDLTDRNC